MKFLTDVLTLEKVVKYTGRFEQYDKPRLMKYKNYYDGKQAITQRVLSDPSKPCNKEVTNFCDNIVNNYLGYLTGKDITYSSQTDISAIQDILAYNDNRTQDSELLRQALIYGRAFEVCYVDEDGKQRFKVLDSRDCFPIYDNTLDENLLAVVRYYPVDELDATQGYMLDLYTADNIQHFKMATGFNSLSLVGEEPHFYGQVPVTIFSLNQEEVSIFDKILTLQDKYNKISSFSTDDYEAFCDAYFYFKGLNDMSAEDAQMMRQNRIILLKDENMDAGYIVKPDKAVDTQTLLKQISDDIHKISNSPDFADSAFGTASGVAMQYKLLGFENVAGSIAANMTKALQKRIELICAILSRVEGDAMWRDVEITFTRNLPTDYTSLAQIVTTLNGIVSQRTLLTLLPFVSDVDKEIEMLTEQKQTNMELYGFGQQVTTEDEEDESSTT